MTETYRHLAHALLRFTVGVVLFFSGVNKVIEGIGNFAARLVDRFEESLPAFLVEPFAMVLPFVELILGLLLMAGLFMRTALAGSAVLMVVLTFGAVMESDPPTAARNVNYALVIFALLWLADYDRYSTDALRRGSTSAADETPSG